MKKIITFWLAAFIIVPAYSLVAAPEHTTEKSAATVLIAANDNAELQPAESGEEAKGTESTESAEGTAAEGSEEKKESKAGFFAGVALMIAFVVMILLKTKKMTSE